jgi:Na+-translocating ferredoxin:NAD+ oxidoreductase RnfG subunit
MKLLHSPFASANEGRWRPQAARRLVMPALLVVVAALGFARSAHGQGTLTQEEALRLAFPAPAQIERRTAYLDEAQVVEARKLAGGSIEFPHRVVTYYAGMRGGNVVGVAYFDSHRVRTLSEVLMIVVGSAGEIQRIEVLRFSEPPEYKASPAWLDQFDGQNLDPDLSLKRGIVNMTGATLSSIAVTNAARRVLALHAVIQPFGTTR